MAQHDYVVANQGFPAFRSDLNDALAAIVSNNSGATEPTTMFAHQLWVDTAADPSILKIRNADNDAWITIGTINQTSDSFKLTPADGVSTDTIAELTSGSGVTIDGVLLKDGLVNSLTVGRGAGDVSTNTAVGASALAANTSGGLNTAIGGLALSSNTSGVENTAVGYNSLKSLTTAASNSAFGVNALYSATTGAVNTAIGENALYSLTTGNNNTAVGHSALQANTTASNNTAVGYQAGYAATGGTNVFIGNAAGDATTTGFSNTYIGNGVDGSAAGNNNEIVIGNSSVGKGSATGFINPNGGGVYQGNNSSSWSTTSDQRLKKNIVDNTEGLEKINALRVRNFEYRLPEEVTDFEASCAVQKTGVQLGVIAQEIQEVCPDCVKEESTGVLSVDSDNVFWHMVNAIKELSAKNDALEARIAALEGN